VLRLFLNITLINVSAAGKAGAHREWPENKARRSFSGKS
jgi:hypothetical protein